MSFIIKNKIWDIKNYLVTDEKTFNSRRKILKTLATGSLFCGGLSTFTKIVLVKLFLIILLKLIAYIRLNAL